MHGTKDRAPKNKGRKKLAEYLDLNLLIKILWVVGKIYFGKMREVVWYKSFFFNPVLTLYTYF